MTFEQVKQEAMGLDLTAREALAHALLETVEQPNELDHADALLEVERRHSEVDDGVVELVPGDEFVARVLRGRR